MKQTLILNYLPTDLNTYINQERTNRYIAAKTKKEETYLVSYLAFTEKMKPFKKKVKIDFHWFVKNKRKDPDNIAFARKFVIDGLVSAKVLKDDGWDEIEGFTDSFSIDKDEKLIVDIIEV